MIKLIVENFIVNWCNIKSYYHGINHGITHIIDGLSSGSMTPQIAMYNSCSSLQWLLIMMDQVSNVQHKSAIIVPIGNSTNINKKNVLTPYTSVL